MSQKRQIRFCCDWFGRRGATFAWRLASKSMNALILETRSGYDPYKEYPLNRYDLEMKTFPHITRMKYTFGNMQDLNDQYAHFKSWDEPPGKLSPSKKRRFLPYQYVVGVGGTTLRFQGEAHRLHPNAFRMKTLFGVAEDWPISYEDLEPYFTWAEKIVGVAGSKAIPPRWRSEPYALPRHHLSTASQIIETGCEKIGLELLPNSFAIHLIFIVIRHHAIIATGRVWGCPRKDKRSLDLTFIPPAEKSGKCQITTNAFARRIELEKENGVKRAKGVFYHDREGKGQFVEGDFKAVACGAVEATRLLINSGINGNELVGKNIMEAVFSLSCCLPS